MISRRRHGRPAGRNLERLELAGNRCEAGQGAYAGILSGVSCLSAARCVAVGSDRKGAREFARRHLGRQGVDNGTSARAGRRDERGVVHVGGQLRGRRLVPEPGGRPAGRDLEREEVGRDRAARVRQRLPDRRPELGVVRLGGPLRGGRRAGAFPAGAG